MALDPSHGCQYGKELSGHLLDKRIFYRYLLKQEI